MLAHTHVPYSVPFKISKILSIIFFIKFNLGQSDTYRFHTIKLIYYFQNTSTIFLKANLEYLRGNYEKAIQFLNSKMKENLDFKYVTYIN